MRALILALVPAAFILGGCASSPVATYQTYPSYSYSQPTYSYSTPRYYSYQYSQPAIVASPSYTPGYGYYYYPR